MEIKEQKSYYIIDSHGERRKLVQVGNAKEMEKQAKQFIRTGRAEYEPDRLDYLKFFLAKDKQIGYHLLRKAVEIEPGVYVNSDKIKTVSKRKAQKIKDDNKYFAVRISDVRDLSLKEAKELKENHPKGVCIKVSNADSTLREEDTYSLDKYIQVMEKFEKITEGINPEMNDEQKFAMIYQRVANSIAYNHRILGINSQIKIERAIAKKNAFDGRNYHALASGEGVCAAFSYALETACKLKGIDCIEVSGPIDIVKDANMPLKNYGKKIKDLDSGKYLERSNHAWNKVKLNGTWYNVDATFDRAALRNDTFPSYALVSDRDMYKNGRPHVDGPRCKVTASEEMIKRIFPNIKLDSHRQIEENEEYVKRVNKFNPFGKLLFDIQNSFSYKKQAIQENLDRIRESFKERVGGMFGPKKLMAGTQPEKSVSNVRFENDRKSNFDKQIRIPDEQLKQIQQKQKDVALGFNNGRANNETDKEEER